MSRDLPVQVRDMTENDTSFIYSTWLKSYRHSTFAKDLSNDVFFAYHKEAIAKILDSDSTRVSMLVNSDDHDQIYGYGIQQLAGKQSITHFIYVKFAFRKLGLATRLIESMSLFPHPINFITHIPRNYQTLKSKYGLEYNPYIITDLVGD